jgi:hypothetical protein
MTNSIDKRGKLKEQPFTFRATKEGRVFIHWHGKQVMILKGSTADKFREAMTKSTPEQAQLIMARITGHFKHGNERSS